MIIDIEVEFTAFFLYFQLVGSVGQIDIIAVCPVKQIVPAVIVIFGVEEGAVSTNAKFVVIIQVRTEDNSKRVIIPAADFVNNGFNGEILALVDVDFLLGGFVNSIGVVVH